MLTLLVTLLNDGSEAYSALQAFLATPAGKDLEAKLASLFTVTTTPGGALVAEPVFRGAVPGASPENGGFPEQFHNR
jgi:hypothetical protein